MIEREEDAEWFREEVVPRLRPRMGESPWLWGAVVAEVFSTTRVDVAELLEIAHMAVYRATSPQQRREDFVRLNRGNENLPDLLRAFDAALRAHGE